MFVKSKFLRPSVLATCVIAQGWMQLSFAADQTVVGAGNARAMQLAKSSPLVTSSMQLLKDNLGEIPSVAVRNHLAELMDQDKACIQSRANLAASDKARLLAELDQAGLVDHAEATRIQGGLLAGVFPPVAEDGTKAPRCRRRFIPRPAALLVAITQSRVGCPCMKRLTI